MLTATHTVSTSDFLWTFALLVLAELLYYATIQISRGEHYGAQNPLMYLFDKRYRWFTHINSLYRESLICKRSHEEFNSWVQRQFIRRSFDHIRFNDEERQTYVCLLSQEQFIKEHFGAEIYSYRCHRIIFRQWKEHLRKNTIASIDKY